MVLTLNVFTLNCWGIPVVSKNRKERFEAIAKYLVSAPHNIVCLQEVWSESDYVYLREKLVDVLPYGHYFYSGVLGSGLCVFSKWVIQDVFFHQWPLNGYIHKLHHGDWFGGKGFGLCRINCNYQIVNVYCTHLHAEYHEDDIYLAHRMLQAYSTAEFVKLTMHSSDISILAGDMNTAPGDLSYRIITKISTLQDPFYMNVENSNPSVRKAMGTSDNANNSYSNTKLSRDLPEGKRIDHIFFHVNNSLETTVLNFGNPLEDRVPGQPFSYSDHNAVSLEFQVRASEKRKSVEEKSQLNDNELFETVAEAIKVCEEAVSTISKTKTVYLTAGGLLFMFLLGTVGLWQDNVLYNVLKLLLSALCFYLIVMGVLWNKMEMNSLKAGLTALQNMNMCRYKQN